MSVSGGALRGASLHVALRGLGFRVWILGLGSCCFVATEAVTRKNCSFGNFKFRDACRGVSLLEVFPLVYDIVCKEYLVAGGVGVLNFRGEDYRHLQLLASDRHQTNP